LGKSKRLQLLRGRDYLSLQFSSTGVLKSFICGVAIKDVERKSPLATCTLERAFQSKHASSEKYLSTLRSRFLLPSLPASPAHALSMGIINFFVPHLTTPFHITFMHLAGEDLTIKGYILSHSAISILCFFAAKCYQLATKHSGFFGEKKKSLHCETLMASNGNETGRQ